MAFKKTSGSVTSLDALFTQVRNFFTGTLGWTQVHSGTQMGTSYYFYHSTGETGSKNIYIGVRSFKYDNLLCGLQFTSCTGINTSEDFDSQPGGFGTYDCYYCQIQYYPNLIAVDDGSSIAYWFIGDKDFAHFMVRIGAAYNSVYAGLINSYWSDSDYALPLIVTSGSARLSYMNRCCTCYCWCNNIGVVPYRFSSYGNSLGGYSGGESSWLRSMDNNSWNRHMNRGQVEVWDSGYPQHANYECLYCWCDPYWFFTTNLYCGSYSTRSQGHVLFPIYVSSYENAIIGELKYIYFSYFLGNTPSESTVYIGGDRYFIVSNDTGSQTNSIAIRDYD